ncbi:MAG TPA: hypothetical protein VG456_08190 [Candidatus Sulfopaludibacter sp.]|jgi:hypothetical protein|nr:hypothetical protein [Candidatus Sulfopaludibacter sp.]
MLKTVDVLIGLTVVMLLASLIVAALTQFVTSAWNSRGRHLLHGVTDLLQQVAPNMQRDLASQIATAVLTHPLIHSIGGRYGDVIHRSELTKILLELAAGSGPQTLGQDARAALVKALQDSGIADPSAAMQKVTEVLSELEASHPDLSNAARTNMALITGAKSAFVTHVNSWFDQTIDRVSDRFTFTARTVTFFMGLLLAFVVQLDTPLLVNRLATDPQLRASMVQQSVALDVQQHAYDNLNSDQRQQVFNTLSNGNLVSVPGSPSEWLSNWSGRGPHPNPTGVLLSAILLSFGAPFWYNALKNLLQLRSVLAQKDDQQRAIRQGTDVTPVSS